MALSTFISLAVSTTGLDYSLGHRVTEICAEKYVNGIKKCTFHRLINPQRDIPLEASRYSGISNGTVKNCPTFVQICDSFLAFVGSDTIVSHKLDFHLGFINSELRRLNRRCFSIQSNVCTLELSYERSPYGRHRLSDMCRKFGIPVSSGLGATAAAHNVAQLYLHMLPKRHPIDRTGVHSQKFSANQESHQFSETSHYNTASTVRVPVHTSQTSRIHSKEPLKEQTIFSGFWSLIKLIVIASCIYSVCLIFG